MLRFTLILHSNGILLCYCTLMRHSDFVVSCGSVVLLYFTVDGDFVLWTWCQFSTLVAFKIFKVFKLSCQREMNNTKWLIILLEIRFISLNKYSMHTKKK